MLPLASCLIVISCPLQSHAPSPAWRAQVLVQNPCTTWSPATPIHRTRATSWSPAATAES